MSKAQPVTVKILEKEYRIACEAGEEEDVLASARLLDKRMREIRSSGKIIGADRIAVMAALNMAHELLGQDQRETANSAETRIRSLRDRIEVALNESNQLEL
ncbi:MAG: cell division protein ZapA [bacterium]